MAAVPKRRTSKGRRDRRRANDALSKVNYSKDKNTGENKLPHRVNMTTGKYKGRQVMEPKV